MSISIRRSLLLLPVSVDPFQLKVINFTSPCGIDTISERLVEPFVFLLLHIIVMGLLTFPPVKCVEVKSTDIRLGKTG